MGGAAVGNAVSCSAVQKQKYSFRLNVGITVDYRLSTVDVRYDVKMDSYPGWLATYLDGTLLHCCSCSCLIFFFNFFCRQLAGGFRCAQGKQALRHVLMFTAFEIFFVLNRGCVPMTVPTNVSCGRSTTTDTGIYE